ncbi:transporter substrate-binding domain-containing protein [Campylobacter sp. US33a]|uniref:Transporter substrate-binding domain-containing protein n=1 Tax=Campylobacter sp. CCS1377 TaxID=3158229 RepID=A0AAU7EA04_9BACT|nr:transporter substrate-binding domain-containing protein [Campylobacter sp. US33a]MCW1361077.1 transporter substrate-binding domain-containing protein [Campylobacter jejuni]TEY00905.1 transporter substrate-binding domain-containing protein [Campylobacter sp. US33a]
MKKILLILVAVFGFLFTACSNADSNEAIRIGIAPNYKPFDYKENAKLTGFDVDLVEEIAKRENVKIEWVEMSFDGLISALKTGKIDMIASAMSLTPERSANMDFTDTYYNTKSLYLKRKADASLNTKEDLIGKSIGVQLGTLQEPTAKAIQDAKVEANEAIAVAIIALKAGKIDAVIADKDVSKGFLAENDDLEGFFEENDGSSGFSFAFDKGKNSQILAKFNKGIKDLQNDGTYQKLLEKYNLQ